MQRVVRWTLVGLLTVAGLTACADSTTAPRSLSPHTLADNTNGARVTKTACEIDPTIPAKFCNDHLVITMTPEYDQLLADIRSGTLHPPYKNAMLKNQWNGMGPGESGVLWHYTQVWTGAVCPIGVMLPDGSQCMGNGVVLVDSFGNIDHDFMRLIHVTGRIDF